MAFHKRILPVTFRHTGIWKRTKDAQRQLTESLCNCTIWSFYYLPFSRSSGIKITLIWGEKNIIYENLIVSSCTLLPTKHLVYPNNSINHGYFNSAYHIPELLWENREDKLRHTVQQTTVFFRNLQVASFYHMFLK